MQSALFLHLKRPLGMQIEHFKCKNNSDHLLIKRLQAVVSYYSKRPNDRFGVSISVFHTCLYTTTAMR